MADNTWRVEVGVGWQEDGRRRMEERGRGEKDMIRRKEGGREGGGWKT